MKSFCCFQFEWIKVNIFLDPVYTYKYVLYTEIVNEFYSEFKNRWEKASKTYNKYKLKMVLPLKLFLLRNYCLCICMYNWHRMSYHGNVIYFDKKNKNILVNKRTKRKKHSHHTVLIYLAATRSTNLFYSTQINGIVPIQIQQQKYACTNKLKYFISWFSYRQVSCERDFLCEKTTNDILGINRKYITLIHIDCFHCF